jgi:uncharacterized HAD superfamily protein
LLCVDIDNVISQTDLVMRQIISEVTQGRVQLRYEDVIEFDYRKCRDKSGQVVSDPEWRTVLDLFSKPERLLSLQPVLDARDALVLLNNHFEVHIVTSRQAGTEDASVAWLDSWQFPHQKIHTTKSKEKHLLPLRFAAIVEDEYEQAASFASGGTRAFLIEHPWNQGRAKVESLEWARNWQVLTKQLVGVARKRNE